jgi:hypothetical protein
MNQTLLAAAQILEASPDAWTQGSFAYDAAGNPARPLDKAATCYCAMGAIQKAAGGHQQVILAASEQLLKHLKRGSIVEWNDDERRTRKEVIAALRAAALHTVTK